MPQGQHKTYNIHLKAHQNGHTTGCNTGSYQKCAASDILLLFLTKIYSVLLASVP